MPLSFAQNLSTKICTVAIASFAALTLLVEQQQEHLTSKTCWNYPQSFLLGT